MKNSEIITFSSKLKMRHEYSHWKDDSEENVSKESEFGLVHMYSS
jgi:hypothetical protein